MPDAQSLFDTLAGAAGHAVNRPALDAAVMQGQALAGLRTAQTDEAIGNARRTQEELKAHDDLENSLGSVLGADGKPAMAPSQAHLAANLMIGHFGDAKTAMSALGDVQSNANRATLSDPNQLGTAAQTAAQQGIEGKVATPFAVPNEYATLPGAVAPQVQQTPLGAADTQQKQALAGLQGTQAAAGGFNPHTGANGAGGANPDPQAIAFGSYMLYKTGKMPPLGMGGGPMRSQIIAGAANLAQQEQQGQDITNPGFETAIANGQDFTGAGRALNSFAGGPLGNQTRALNNGIGHLRLYEDTFNALNNGDIQGLNKLSAMWQKQTGGPAPTTLHAMSSIIGPELTKILSNTNAGTGEERQQFAQDAGNLANAPEQTTGAIHALRGMLGRQAADLALQYHGATGRGDFAKRYLQSDVANDLQLNPDNAQQVPGTGGAPAAPGAPAPVAPAVGASTMNLDQYLKSKGH